MASNLKVDIVRPTATNGSLALKGDSGGSATPNGVTVNSSGNTSITGTTTVSSLVATTADINGGTIDNAAIGGNVPAAGAFTSLSSNGINDGSTDANAAVAINSSNQVSIGKRSVYGESADFNDINGTRSDIAATVTSGNNAQAQTALVVVGGLYNQAGTNRTSVDIHHQGKNSGNGIGWRLESRADSNSVGTDNSEFAIRKVNLGGTSGSLSTTYSDAITIDASGNVQLSGNLSVPNFVGMICAFAMGSAPNGWLACDGSAISRTTYANLFTAIGTTWGVGDGSTTFNLPDLRGAFLRGSGSHGTETMADTNAFAGPSVGSFENDQIQKFKSQLRFGSQSVTAGGTAGSLGYDNPTLGTAITVGTLLADGYGTLRSGDETRPFNAGVRYCIKF